MNNPINKLRDAIAVANRPEEHNMKTLEQIAADNKLRLSQVRGGCTATNTPPSAIKGAQLYDAAAETRIVAAARAARDAAQTVDSLAADKAAQKKVPVVINEISGHLEAAIATCPAERISPQLAEDLYANRTGRALVDDFAHCEQHTSYKADARRLRHTDTGTLICQFTMEACRATGKKFGTGRAQ